MVKISTNLEYEDIRDNLSHLNNNTNNYLLGEYIFTSRRTKVIKWRWCSRWAFMSQKRIPCKRVRNTAKDWVRLFPLLAFTFKSYTRDYQYTYSVRKSKAWQRSSFSPSHITRTSVNIVTKFKAGYKMFYFNAIKLQHTYPIERNSHIGTQSLSMPTYICKGNVTCRLPSLLYIAYIQGKNQTQNQRSDHQDCRHRRH